MRVYTWIQRGSHQKGMYKTQNQLGRVYTCFQRENRQRGMTNTNQPHASTRELRAHIQQDIANLRRSLLRMLFQKDNHQKGKNM